VVCILIYISEIFVAAVHKSPGRAWIDADIFQVLSRRHKSVLASDLNVKNRVWNSGVSELSGEKFLIIWRKLIRKFSGTVSHSLLSYGKWRRTQYYGPSEYQIIRSDLS
jgi:hypothetical protein